MRIMLVSPFPLPDACAQGGVEAVAAALLQGFAKIPSTEVRLLSFCHSRDLDISLGPGITVRYVRRKFGNRKLELAFHAKKVLYREFDAWGADILHIEGNGSSLLLLDPRYAARTVVTPHGILSGEIRQYREMKLKVNVFLSRLIEKAFWPRVRNLVYISDYSRRYFSLPASAVSATISNPVGDEFFSVQDTPRAGIFFYVGRLTSLKGADDLLKAVISLYEAGEQEFRLEIIGGGASEGFMAELERLSGKVPGRMVRFLGWKGGDDLRAAVREAGCIIVPSHQENAPMVIAEAMAMGKVVIASDVGGIREMVSDGENGFLFTPGDIAGLANCIRKVLGLSGIRLQEMGVKSRELAIERYSSAAVASETVAFYSRILTRHTTDG